MHSWFLTMQDLTIGANDVRTCAFHDVFHLPQFLVLPHPREVERVLATEPVPVELEGALEDIYHARTWVWRLVKWRYLWFVP